MTDGLVAEAIEALLHKKREEWEADLMEAFDGAYDYDDDVEGAISHIAAHMGMTL